MNSFFEELEMVHLSRRVRLGASCVTVIGIFLKKFGPLNASGMSRDYELGNDVVTARKCYGDGIDWPMILILTIEWRNETFRNEF